jgi:hypothetical protein
MGTDRRILGQAQATTAGLTLYTVPASVSDAVISLLTVCNTGATTPTYRVAVVPKGVTLALRHYVRYDVTIGANATADLLRGATLAAGDSIFIRASADNILNFCLFGQESSY